MAIYRYIVTVEMAEGSTLVSKDIENEIDSNLEFGVAQLDIEHFTVEPLPARAYPGQGFVTAPMSPDGRYLS